MHQPLPSFLRYLSFQNTDICNPIYILLTEMLLKTQLSCLQYLSIQYIEFSTPSANSSACGKQLEGRACVIALSKKPNFHMNGSKNRLHFHEMPKTRECRTKSRRADLPKTTEELVFLKKICKLSQEARSLQETWGNQQGLPGPPLSLGMSKEVDTEPEDFGIRFPPIPGDFGATLRRFCCFFKGQETQPRGRAEQPESPAHGARRSSQSPRSDSLYKAQPLALGTRRSDSSELSSSSSLPS